MDNSYVFPMSSGQERMWMLNQMNDNITIYNLPVVIDIKGPIDFPLLEKSVILLVQRHEILRTSFNLIDNNPSQVVYDEGLIALTYTDLTGSTSQVRENQSREAVHKLVNAAFDIKEGPLLRLNLIKKKENHNTLVIVMHHIISDSLSLRLLVEELMFNYEQLLKDSEYQSEELPIQYADYTIWQNKWLQSDQYTKELNYWKNNLESPIEYTNLPIDKPRPAIQSYNGAVIKFEIPQNLYNLLEVVSKENNATIFMTLFSGFSMLITQLSRQNEIAIGTPIMSRPRKELEGLIGFFVNTLVIRSEIVKGQTYAEFLKETRDVLIAAFSNSNLPFEKLIEVLNPKRNLSFSPLFQVMFSMHDEKSYPLKAANLELTILDTEQSASKFDFTLHIEKTNGGATGIFEYNTDLFECESINRYISRYMAIITKIAENQNELVSKMLAIPNEEKITLLEWNSTQLAYESSDTIISQLEEQVKSTPDAIALIHENEQYSYFEISQAAHLLAGRLIETGINKGDVVGLFIDRSIEMVIGIFGILKSGATFLPLDPKHPQDRLEYMVTSSQLSAVVGFEKYEKRIASWKKPVVFIDRIMSESSEPAHLDLVINPEAIAYMMFTSGSTGKPKAVSVRHRNVVNFFAGMDQAIGKEPGTFLALTTYTFDISILELIWTITRGFKVIIQTEIRNSNISSRNKVLDFSLFYFASSEDSAADEKYKLLLDGAKYGDENGFNAVWVPERHFHEFGGIYPNPSVLGAALAVMTQKINIRAGSVVFPLHNPIRIAEEWSVVDNLSNGRVGIAAASGWHVDDFVFYPKNYNNRQEVMYDSLNKVRKLWRGESVGFMNGNEKLKEVKIYPGPLQKELPVWITSGGNIETFRSAGKLGLNILTHLLGNTIENLSEKIDAYRTSLKENGFEPESGKVSIMLHTYIGEDIEEVHREVRMPLINYLKSSAGLVQKMFESEISNGGELSESDIDALLNNSFERYVKSAGLIGTKESCTEILDKLYAIGIDEIACLIDFGLDYSLTMKSLGFIKELKDEYNSNLKSTVDFSIPEQLVKHNITHFQCTPSLMRMLNADLKIYEKMKSVKRILLGGEKLPLDLVKDVYSQLPDVEIFNMYGPTETTIWSTVSKVDRQTDKIFIGKPIANTQIHILSDEMEVLPIGVKGSMYIGGDGVSAGYLSDHERHAKSFVKSPFSDGLIYKTGDIGRYANSGNIEIFGREDEQIKIRGYRIELGEIEAVINTCEIVREVGIYIDDSNNSPEIVACISLNNTQGETYSDQKENKDLLSLNDKKTVYKSSGRSLYQLPNGLSVDHYNAHTTNLMYKEVFIDNDYIKHGIILNEGSCVIDAGSNIGLFSLMIHSRFKNINIFAFEPIPTTFERLQNNFENYGIKGRAYNKGLSSKNETVQFTHYPNMSGISGRFSNTGSDIMAAKNVAKSYMNDHDDQFLQEMERLIENRYETENYSCELTTISDVIKENNLKKIDLLKIDVEKSELLVLKGISDDDWDKIEQFVLEVDTREHKEEVIRILEARGYNLFVHNLVEVDKKEDNPNDVFAYIIYATKKSAKALETVELSIPESLSFIKKYVKDKLPEYMVPTHFKVIDEFKLNTNGKIDRNALKNSKSKVTTLPEKITADASQPMSEVISNIWKSLLQLDTIDPNKNFFDLGGHSLLLIKMQASIEEILNIKISVIELFKYPTIDSLSQYLGYDKQEKSEYDRAALRKNRLQGKKNRA
ncbi:MupA/Atu3671 family FMN-dependent luciferase-like monooxygenase [Chryseobacterium sp. JV558]|uniref:MupA/Atu3671 family FMN-dependent luciferase-like monooxygenase n=1 Tax=Chryseobacterium sp. JV558 TaxID=2663236 RepID=UPI00299D6765|nr:MupA/Atu3671 family FMN-dependent luciferase-like monooxygenase [Chryseobacterium sp. JV558]MDW9382508.1 LLM class flavin-dependent oxidoreductase [Chryseobacterium sp. JV558]